MVHEIVDSFEFESDNEVYNEKNSRYITFEYSTNNTDVEVIKKYGTVKPFRTTKDYLL